MDFFHILLICIVLALCGASVYLLVRLQQVKRQLNLIGDAFADMKEGNRFRLVAADGSEQSRKILGDINDILLDHRAQLVRKKQAARTLHMERSDVCAITRAVVSECRPLLEGGGLLLEAEIPDQPLIAVLDQPSYAQALKNLLQDVIVRGGAKEVRVRVCKDGGQAAVSVLDDGLAIPAEDMPELFKETESGQSLLPDVNTLVTSQRGKLQAKSTPGEGTCFTMTYPMGA